MGNVPEKLETVTLCSGFSDSWIERLSQYSIQKSYAKDTLIFAEGDESDGIFFILEGGVRVYMSDESGKEILIANLGPGEMVGEVASLDGQPRTASVATTGKTRVAKINRTEFRTFLADNPELALEIIRVLTSRIRDHSTSISNLVFKNVYGRIVWLLEKYSEPNEDGTFTVNRKFTQQDIAHMVGASREMVSRVFSDLVKGEYISIKRKIITIHRALPRGW